MKKNVASQFIGVQMTTTADGTDFTGAVTCTIAKDGAALGASAGTGPTHQATGYYEYSPTQAETNADHIAFHFTGTGAISTTVQVYTSFPQTVDVATNVPNVLNTTALGNIGIDWANIENPTTAVDLSGTDIQLADTVTTLTTLPAITANWLTAAGINAGALDGKGNWNIGKTGYALTTADWNVGKTGYSLTVTPPTAVQNRTEMDSNSTQLATLAGGIIEGTTTGTPTTTSTNTDLTGYLDSELVGRAIVFTAGGIADGQAATILTYTATDGVVTFAALTTAPAASDPFKIV